MKASKEKRSKPEQNRGRAVRMLLGASVKVLVATVIVVVALAAYRYQIKTSPRLGRKKPPRQAKLVQVINVHNGDCTTTEPVTEW